MYKERNLQSVYSACSIEGSFLPISEINAGQLQSMFDLALSDLASVQEWIKHSKKDGTEWNAIFKLHYDILHSLIECFVYFDNLKIKTHECLFAHLCEKHPELDFDWIFLEKIRMKRNRSIYYGQSIKYFDWKETELQFNLYINTLKKEIIKKKTRK